MIVAKRVLWLSAILSVALGWTGVLPVSQCRAQIDEASLETLVEQLTDSDVGRRRDAAYELVRRQEPTTVVVEAWGQALKDGDVQVRFQSLLGLARAGQTAAPAIPQLLELLDDRSDQIRFRAADALGKIGPEALQPLLDGWPNGNRRFKIAAAMAWAEMGPTAEPAVPLLQEALSDSNDRLLQEAATALIAIRPDDQPLLLDLSQHSDAQVRLVAVPKLAALAQQSPALRQRLEESLSDNEPRVRQLALVALTKLPLAAAELEQVLEAGLLDPDVSVQSAALVARRQAGIPAQPLARRLAEQLPEADSENSRILLRGLAGLGLAASPFLPDMLEAIEKLGIADPQAEEETNSQSGLNGPRLARALSEMGPGAVEPLVASLSQRPSLQETAAQALGLIGGEAQSALPALQALLASLPPDDPEVDEQDLDDDQRRNRRLRAAVETALEQIQR